MCRKAQVTQVEYRKIVFFLASINWTYRDLSSKPQTTGTSALIHMDDWLTHLQSDSKLHCIR